jgi:E3 ubiquitin-protein ligase HECTD3
MRKNAKTMSDEEFKYGVDQNFMTVLNNGQEVEVCEDGKEKMVTKDNIEEYIQLVLKTRFAEGKEQIAWIREGIQLILDTNIMSMLNWEEVEIRSSGDKTVDITTLKNITIYQGCNSTDKIIEMFWEMFEEFSEEDRQKYLKFVWGRSRLPSDCSQLRYKHTIYVMSHKPDGILPEAHTCFF